MNYYNEIKEILVNNEITKRIKDYSKNRSDLESYYKVGKILFDAGKHYGEGIIKEYSKRLTCDLDASYDVSSLNKMRKFYILIEKMATVSPNLSYSHYVELLPYKDINKVKYYIKIIEMQNLSVRQLRKKIKSKEYERLDESTKQKLITKEENKVTDFVKNPIIIKNSYNYTEISEKALKRLILEDIDNFLKELGKGYSQRNLYNMELYYLYFSQSPILQPLAAKLTWTHYSIILPLKDPAKIKYYAIQVENYNLSKRELINKIKSKEYERLDESTKQKLMTRKENKVTDFIKNPIIIKNNYNYNEISEKVLKKLILEDMNDFLTELGDGFCYIKNEYKIKIGDRYNYIDLLLFNIEFNCYIVVELKVTELKKENIGQIQTYMNYIDKNIKKVNHDKTIGIIIVKKDNKLILEYSSDSRIYSTTYIVN